MSDNQPYCEEKNSHLFQPPAPLYHASCKHPVGGGVASTSRADRGCYGCDHKTHDLRYASGKYTCHVEAGVQKGERYAARQTGAVGCPKPSTTFGPSRFERTVASLPTVKPTALPRIAKEPQGPAPMEPIVIGPGSGNGNGNGGGNGSEGDYHWSEDPYYRGDAPVTQEGEGIPGSEGLQTKHIVLGFLVVAGLALWLRPDFGRDDDEEEDEYSGGRYSFASPRTQGYGRRYRPRD